MASSGSVTSKHWTSQMLHVLGVAVGSISAVRRARARASAG
jgi:hypothetical protein